jgi:hypothetical protein
VFWGVLWRAVLCSGVLTELARVEVSGQEPHWAVVGCCVQTHRHTQYAVHQLESLHTKTTVCVTEAFAVGPRCCLVCCLSLLLLLPRPGEQARERDWANVITAHAGEPAAYTWRLAHFTLGQHALLPPDAPQQQHLQAGPPVSAVGISCCGNFGLVGTEGGRVDRYNLQSGIHRGTYWRQQPQQQQQQAGAAGEGHTRGTWQGAEQFASLHLQLWAVTWERKMHVCPALLWLEAPQLQGLFPALSLSSSAVVAAARSRQRVGAAASPRRHRCGPRL